MTLIIVALGARAMAAAILAAIITQQIRLYMRHAPVEVQRFKRLLIALSVSMLAGNILAMAQWGAAITGAPELSPDPRTFGTVLYVATNLFSDIITVSILHLIYKEAKNG